MKTLTLSKGYVAVVDDEDYEWLSQWHWKADVSPSGNVYARRNHWVSSNDHPSGRKSVSIRMHREILGLPNGDPRQGDHINGDTLDNRRTNLRVATNSQNQMNTPLRKDNKSGCKGVWWGSDRGRWRAEINVNGETIRLGSFTARADAVAARKIAEQRYFGRRARKELV